MRLFLQKTINFLEQKSYQTSLQPAFANAYSNNTIKSTATKDFMKSFNKGFENLKKQTGLQQQQIFKNPDFKFNVNGGSNFSSGFTYQKPLSNKQFFKDPNDPRKLWDHQDTVVENVLHRDKNLTKLYDKQRTSRVTHVEGNRDLHQYKDVHTRPDPVEKKVYDIKDEQKFSEEIDVKAEFRSKTKTEAE